MLREFNDGIKLMLREFFNKETNKRQRANMWTFSRLVLAFSIPITALVGKITNVSLCYILAASFTTLGTITDFMDGKSARKYGSTSDFGKKLDILADKVFAFMLGISLSLINPMFLFNILGEAIISYTNVSYQKKYHQLVPKSNYIGKIKQWPLSIAFILGFLSIFLPQLKLATNTFIIISFLMELVASINYINTNNIEIKKFDKENNSFKQEDTKINKQKTLKDEYIKLRNVLLEIKTIKEEDMLKENIKTKKRK